MHLEYPLLQIKLSNYFLTPILNPVILKERKIDENKDKNNDRKYEKR